MNYLDGLNQGQLDSVRTTEGPVRVLAGAGTGKTRALTARYCYLADLLGIDPGSVLCVTFTNKAAAEMKQRIRALLGDFDMAYICTFHSFCVRMLKEDIHVLNYPANFVLLDEEDQCTVLQKVYSDMGLTLKELPIRRAVDYIGKRKGAADYVPVIEKMSNAEPPAMSDVGAADRLPEIYMRYLYEQKKTYAIDFDDVIVFAHHILVNYPDIRHKWQQRMQYVMVDEFQDVSNPLARCRRKPHPRFRQALRGCYDHRPLRQLPQHAPDTGRVEQPDFVQHLPLPQGIEATRCARCETKDVPRQKRERRGGVDCQDHSRARKRRP